jgi:probable O-glycosylation ligase (exosortase A-associated)
MGPIFVYLMTYGGAVVALFNPFVGLLIYVSFAILKPQSIWYWSVRPGNYSRIVALGLLAGWVLNGFGRWDMGRGKAVILALIAFFIWVVCSAALAPDQEIAWYYVETYGKFVVPVVVGITVIDSVPRLKLLAWVMLLSQAYPAYELNRSYFAGYNRLREEGGFGALDNNGYACALVTCVGLAGFLTWHSERWWQKAIAAASGGFVIHAILFSNSRGGMLGLIATGMAAFVVMPKGRKELSAFALAVVMVLAFAGPQVWQRFQTTFAEEEDRDASAESRLELWAACLDLAVKNPVFGIGPGHFRLVSYQYGFEMYKEAHTLWILCGAEYGFPGMLLLLSYYGVCLTRVWPIARGKIPVSDPWLVYLARMVIASLVGFAVSAQFLSLGLLEAPYYIAMMGACILKLSMAPSGSPAGVEG